MVTRGWHTVVCSSARGRNQAQVEGNRDKWILIRRDPGKREGFGIHISEVPI
jgi:hypothetical protein